MKNKIITLSLLVSLFWLSANSQIKPYTIKEVKDTISKYNNIFKAYEYLEKGIEKEL